MTTDRASDGLHHRTLGELAKGLSSGEFSSRELTEALLARIERHGKTLNAFITVTADAALAQADRADKERANGDAGPLSGLPIKNGAMAGSGSGGSVTARRFSCRQRSAGIRLFVVSVRLRSAIPSSITGHGMMAALLWRTRYGG